MFRVKQRIFFTEFRTVFRKLLHTTISCGAQGVQRTILGCIRLIKRQMNAVFPWWKLLWITAGFPFISVDMKFFRQKIPVKFRIQTVVLK